MIEFELPLPGLGCAPNVFGARVKMRDRKTLREAAYICALATCRKEKISLPLGKCVIDYEFFLAPQRGSYHPRDWDNAVSSMKGAQDGFARAGVFKADDARTVRVRNVSFRRVKKEHMGRACVIVRIVPDDEPGGSL